MFLQSNLYVVCIGYSLFFNNLNTTAVPIACYDLFGFIRPLRVGDAKSSSDSRS